MVVTVRSSTSAAPAGRLAFEFLILTAARSSEVRLATWYEMDEAGRVWTISVERMKAKREHRVPLCGRAVEVLDAAWALGDGNPLVVPMRSGKPIASAMLAKMLRLHRIADVSHGFRSSFLDWAAEQTYHPRGWSRRSWRTSSPIRWRRRMRGRTFSSVVNGSWTNGRRTLLGASTSRATLALTNPLCCLLARTIPCRPPSTS